MGAGVKRDPEEERDIAAALALRVIAQIDRLGPEESLAFFKRYADREERNASRSIATGNEYAHAQEIFANEVSQQLCRTARDDLFKVTRIPARKRPVEIRRWVVDPQIAAIVQEDAQNHDIAGEVVAEQFLCDFVVADRVEPRPGGVSDPDGMVGRPRRLSGKCLAVWEPVAKHQRHPTDEGHLRVRANGTIDDGRSVPVLIQ